MPTRAPVGIARRYGVANPLRYSGRERKSGRKGMRLSMRPRSPGRSPIEHHRASRISWGRHRLRRDVASTQGVSASPSRCHTPNQQRCGGPRIPRRRIRAARGIWPYRNASAIFAQNWIALEPARRLQIAPSASATAAPILSVMAREIRTPGATRSVKIGRPWMASSNPIAMSLSLASDRATYPKEA